MFKKLSSVICLLLLTALLFLYNWNQEAAQSVHSGPQINKTDIHLWVQRRELPAPLNYHLAKQTGVNTDVVKRLLAENKGFSLLSLQAAYFAQVRTVDEPSSPLTVSEYLVDEDGDYSKGTQFADIRKGDILITKNSRFLGWRNGHVGLVVDVKKGLVLEALMLGVNTKLCYLSKWETLPSFQVLRLKEGINSSPLENICFSWLVAEYAAEHLVDIPYSLLAGINRKELTINDTHCAHLIWYAYKQFGIDLDSDGGIIVTPEDIRRSPYLEVIQSYGY